MSSSILFSKITFVVAACLSGAGIVSVQADIGPGPISTRVEVTSGTTTIVGNTTIQPPNGQVAVTASGSGAILLDGTDGLISIIGDGATGLYASGAARISTRNTQLAVITNNANARGVFVSNGGVITIDAGLTQTTIDTYGSSSVGVAAQYADSIVQLDNARINTFGSNAYGVQSYSGGQVKLNLDNASSSSITTTNSTAHGLYANAGGVISGRNLTIDTQGAGAHGINADGSSSNIVLTSGIIVNTFGVGSRGVVATNGGSIDLGMGASITTNSLSTGTSYGIHAATNATNSTIIGDSVTVQTKAGTASAVVADATSTITLTGSNTITTTGANARGVFANSGKITLSGGADAANRITTGLVNDSTAGASAYALYAAGGTAQLTASNIFINTYGTNGYGVFAGTGAQVTLNPGGTDTGTITTGVLGNAAFGGTAYALYASNASAITGSNLSLTTYGTTAYGAWAASASTISLSDTSIDTHGTNASGIFMTNAGSEVKTNAAVSVTTHGTNAHGILVQNGAQKTYDGTDGNIFPSIIVSGDSSAVVAALGNAAAAQVTLVNVSLSTAMTAGSGTWGAKAGTLGTASGTVVFDRGSSTGGTALWAAGNGIFLFKDNAAAAGSRVLLEADALFDISSTTSGLTIGSLEGAGGVLLGAQTLTIGGTVTTADSASTAFSGIINGTGKLVKKGTGTLSLNGASSYTGETIINSGTLVTGVSNAIASSSSLTVNAGGTFSTGAATQTVNNLQGAGRIELPSNLAMNATTATTFGGILIGAGAFTKNGAANFTLTGNSDAYAGSFTLDQGKLTLTGTLGNGTANFAANSGTTLTGIGKLAQNAVFHSGATLSPGLDVPVTGRITLTVANDVVLEAGSIFAITLVNTTTYTALDQIGGTFTANNALLQIDFTAYTPVLNDRFCLVMGFDENSIGAGTTFSYNGIDNLANDSILNIALQDFRLSYEGGSIYLINLAPIPEPATGGLWDGVALIIGVVSLRRRRKG